MTSPFALISLWQELIEQFARANNWTTPMLDAFSQVTDADLEMLGDIQQRCGSDAELFLRIILGNWPRFMGYVAARFESSVANGSGGIPDISSIHTHLELAIAFARQHSKIVPEQPIEPESDYVAAEAFKPLKAAIDRAEAEGLSVHQLTPAELRALGAPSDHGKYGEGDIIDVTPADQMHPGGKSVLIKGGKPLTAEQQMAIAQLTGQH